EVDSESWFLLEERDRTRRAARRCGDWLCTRYGFLARNGYRSERSGHQQSAGSNFRGEDGRGTQHRDGPKRRVQFHAGPPRNLYGRLDTRWFSAVPARQCDDSGGVAHRARRAAGAWRRQRDGDGRGGRVANFEYGGRYSGESVRRKRSKGL